MRSLWRKSAAPIRFSQTSHREPFFAPFWIHADSTKSCHAHATFVTERDADRAQAIGAHGRDQSLFNSGHDVVPLV